MVLRMVAHKSYPVVALLTHSMLMCTLSALITVCSSQARCDRLSARSNLSVHTERETRNTASQHNDFKMQ